MSTTSDEDSGSENGKKGWFSNWFYRAKDVCRTLLFRAKADSPRRKEFDVDADIIELIMTSDLRTDFKQLTLSPHQSEFDWTPDSQTVVITYHGRELSEEEWDYTECMHAVYTYINKFTKRDIQVENEFWPAVLKKLPVIRAALSHATLRLEEIPDSNAIRLICLKSELEHLVNELQDNLAEIREAEVSKKQFQCVMRRFLFKQQKSEIKLIENKLKQFQVKVEKGDSKEDFAITGTTEDLLRAQEKLKELTSKPCISTDTRIQQAGLRKLFLNDRAQAIVQSVEREHECVVEVQHNFTSETESAAAGMENFDSEQESDDEFDPDGEVRTQHVGMVAELPDRGVSTLVVGNCGITWKAEHITEEQAAELVSSEESYAVAMTETADSGVGQAQAFDQGEDVIATATGCSHVINLRSYGPRGTADKTLESTVHQALTEAACLQKNSIVFTVIGADKHDLPPDAASRAMLNEAIQFCQVSQSCSITDVQFVVFIEDQRVISAFKQEIVAMQRGHGFEESIRICVKQGDITREQTDAIVNINSTDMNMKHAGALGKVVARASGPVVQRECRKAGEQKPGAAVMTSGGKLAVKHIIHSVPGSSDKRHLQQCVESCLKLADTAGLRSISLPAFGTGGYGMPAQYSSELMFQALENFLPTSQNVREINIVIFQQEMVETFTEEQQRRTEGLLTSNTTHFPVLPGSLASKVSRETRVKTVAPVSISENDQVVTFCVLGKNAENTKKAIEALTNSFSAEYRVRKVEDKDIRLLTEWEINHLQRRATSLDVLLSVESTMDRITVRGNLNDVLTLVQEIWATLNIRKDKERVKEQAKLVSKTVQWHYIEVGVKKRFDEESNLELEMAYADDKTKVAVSVLGEIYSLSLADKTGTGQMTGKHITLTREVLGAANQGIALPTHWTPMSHDSQTGNDVTIDLVDLTPGTQECRTVAQMFQATKSNVRLRSIQRVQNPHLYQAYMMRKQKMDKDNGGRNNERQLFHGTAAENVRKINTQGFNRSFAGTHGKAYGAGVYFAKDASYSVDYVSGNTGSKPMYIARVLVGQYVLGNSGMMVPPPKNASRPEITYESTVDNASNPSIFVVFYDNQCYPEYLIRF